MRSSRRLRLTPEARDDLRDLLQYTLETWGREQRDRYKSVILRSLRELTQFPELGRGRDDLDVGLRSHPVGQHLVIYWLGNEEIVVTRIMHSRRDIEDELGR